MKELTLDELKAVEFEILEFFDAFCKENNIKYFLSNGTLLGAVKYKGFIPWDDDVDVLIPRADYDKMIKIFKDTERYRLCAFERDENYLYPIAKLCDMTTRKDEFVHTNGVELGVDIDLFPLDAWDDDLEKAKKEARYISKNMFRLGLTKLKKPDSHHPIKRFIKGIAMIFCKMRGSKYYIRKIIKASAESHGKNSKYLGCKSWCIYGTREIIPSSVFDGIIDIEFEGARFPAPVGYDTYLRSLYGDYPKDPPIEKQRTHHSFKAYRV